MSNQENFQKLVVQQFAKMNEQFGKIGEQLQRIEVKLGEHDQKFERIEQKQKEHDQRFDSLDKNIDIVARHARKLVDNDNDLANVYLKRISKGGTSNDYKKNS